jgi:hypothetical protein
LLLGNVVRAVDEVYFLCEMECGAPEIEGTASLLEACAADFKALLARVGDQERFLETHDDKKNTSISWDVGRVAVRPSDASREMIRAVVDADKEKREEKGAWRPAGGKRGERRREKEKAEKAEGPRGKPSRRERRGKGAERMIDSDENTSAEKEETSKAVADDARVRLPAKAKTKTLAPGSKPGAPRPPRPAAEVSSREALFAEPDKKQKSGDSNRRTEATPSLTLRAAPLWLPPARPRARSGRGRTATTTTRRCRRRSTTPASVRLPPRRNRAFRDWSPIRARCGTRNATGGRFWHPKKRRCT